MTVTAAPPVTLVPALYETTIDHLRQSPFRHAFTYRSYWWLVDLDHLPILPRGMRSVARFHAADHVGDPLLSIRANLEGGSAGGRGRRATSSCGR